MHLLGTGGGERRVQPVRCYFEEVVDAAPVAEAVDVGVVDVKVGLAVLQRLEPRSAVAHHALHLGAVQEAGQVHERLNHVLVALGGKDSNVIARKYT